ncbi:hypothetical protein PMAYCL1PPCAC_25016, partial [Pristionchus mayeri]
ALIHISCEGHEQKEKKIKSSITDDMSRVIMSITELPMRLREIESENADRNLKRQRHVFTADHRPSTKFIQNLYYKYVSLVCIGAPLLTDEQHAAMEANPELFEAKTLIGRVKSDYGKKAM